MNFFFFFSSRRRHTRFDCDWSSDVCSSDLGFARVRVDGFVRDLSEDITLDKMKKHSIEVVVDRLIVRRGAEAEAERSRLTDSVETALRLGEGLALVADADGKGGERLFSERLAG